MRRSRREEKIEKRREEKRRSTLGPLINGDAIVSIRIVFLKLEEKFVTILKDLLAKLLDRSLLKVFRLVGKDFIDRGKVLFELRDKFFVS